MNVEDTVMKNWGTKSIFMISVMAVLFVQPALAFDFSSWDGLLKKYVSPKTINGVKDRKSVV